MQGNGEGGEEGKGRSARNVAPRAARRARLFWDAEGK